MGWAAAIPAIAGVASQLLSKSGGGGGGSAGGAAVPSHVEQIDKRTAATDHAVVIQGTKNKPVFGDLVQSLGSGDVHADNSITVVASDKNALASMDAAIAKSFSLVDGTDSRRHSEYLAGLNFAQTLQDDAASARGDFLDFAETSHAGAFDLVETVLEQDRQRETETLAAISSNLTASLGFAQSAGESADQEIAEKLIMAGAVVAVAYIGWRAFK